MTARAVLRINSAAFLALCLCMNQAPAQSRGGSNSSDGRGTGGDNSGGGSGNGAGNSGGGSGNGAGNSGGGSGNGAGNSRGGSGNGGGHDISGGNDRPGGDSGQGTPGPGLDHERARKAVENGEARRLSAFVSVIERVYDGRMIDVALHRRRSMLVYDIKMLSKAGRVFVVSVDARTGQPRPNPDF